MRRAAIYVDNVIYVNEAAPPHFPPQTGFDLAKVCAGLLWYKNVLPNFTALTESIFATFAQLRSANRNWRDVLLNKRTGWTPAHNSQLERFKAEVMPSIDFDDVS
eukprot:GHVU01117989.1.p1 GENE.GHVU01117989.1~~GHVU01117989.1.p1  ORF type:complete len:105 (-),score=11.35 GHVU01117989.1:218-532(-)